MANQIIEDFKLKLRNGNPVTRLIIINVAVFLIISIFRILTFLSGEASFLNSIENFLQQTLSQQEIVKQDMLLAV